MRPKAERSGVFLLFFLLAVAVSAQAAGRVALVVGNSDYAHVGRLPTPVFDADAGAALRRLGFEVTQVRDADLSALTDALRAFTLRSAGADVALVFYAGHGMEMDGVNYLLAVDARLERDTDVRYETVTLDDVLRRTIGSVRTSIRLCCASTTSEHRDSCYASSPPSTPTRCRACRTTRMHSARTCPRASSAHHISENGRSAPDPSISSLPYGRASSCPSAPRTPTPLRSADDTTRPSPGSATTRTSTHQTNSHGSPGARFGPSVRRPGGTRGTRRPLPLGGARARGGIEPDGTVPLPEDRT